MQVIIVHFSANEADHSPLVWDKIQTAERSVLAAALMLCARCTDTHSASNFVDEMPVPRKTIFYRIYQRVKCSRTSAFTHMHVRRVTEATIHKRHAQYAQTRSVKYTPHDKDVAANKRPCARAPIRICRMSTSHHRRISLLWFSCACRSML